MRFAYAPGVVAVSFAVLLGARIPAQETWAWGLPAGFPPPTVPADNPMTAEKVELGRHLFYDTRLSGNGRQACASCHEQAKAFTDGRARSIGSTGQQHPRGSMSLVNVAYARVLTWGTPSVLRLEDQALIPMYADDPVELGLNRGDDWLQELARDAGYQTMFAAAFTQPQPVTRDNVVKALATFQRAIVSARSPYDRHHFERDDAALSDAAKRGEVLFHSRPFACFTCHGGLHFSGAMGGGRRAMAVEFHNTGLYNLPGPWSYPQDNTGIHETTRDPGDIGKFKPPTLRNIAVTAPYMHDGSVATLEDAIDHYAAGGRTISRGPYQGVGRDNPNKSAELGGFTITSAQRADLVAFLQSLTDAALLHDPRFASPFTDRPRR